MILSRQSFCDSSSARPSAAQWAFVAVETVFDRAHWSEDSSREAVLPPKSFRLNSSKSLFAAGSNFCVKAPPLPLPLHSPHENIFSDLPRGCRTPPLRTAQEPQLPISTSLMMKAISSNLATRWRVSISRKILLASWRSGTQETDSQHVNDRTKHTFRIARSSTKRSRRRSHPRSSSERRTTS